MTPLLPETAFPRFGDVAHVGHVELLTPKPDASLAFFTSTVDLRESGRSGDSVYLRGWGDYEWHTLKLTAHTTSGLGHMGLRVRDQATLERFVSRLEASGVSGTQRAASKPAAATGATSGRGGPAGGGPIFGEAEYSQLDSPGRVRRLFNPLV